MSNRFFSSLKNTCLSCFVVCPQQQDLVVRGVYWSILQCFFFWWNEGSWAACKTYKTVLYARILSIDFSEIWHTGVSDISSIIVSWCCTYSCIWVVFVMVHRKNITYCIFINHKYLLLISASVFFVHYYALMLKICHSIAIFECVWVYWSDSAATACSMEGN